ncbi:polysaccharide biosynthesis C-terminal domain-containing protein [Alicyclobacillus tolerans]|uniref:lipopolysaccharide biosynthesis protein n=1 Tax=Alicyclobacillus tolerans TaxID=90970 RepID=UPI001F3FCA4F|nr:polysaccharide biosynthesis C-terminal domain-containing protein [Alicyclobacillus tolerans]MCF8565395.1 polysaccharide biosynthesis C-terminal domain-containing protein [Alicyclobacillus tolerans]
MIGRLFRTVFYKLGTSGLSFLIGILTAHLLTVAERGFYSSVGITLLLGNTFLEGYASFFNFGLNRLKLDRQQVVSTAVRHVLLISLVSLVLLAVALPLSWKHPLWLQLLFILGALPFIVTFSYCSRLLQALNEIDLLNRLNLIQPVTLMIGLIFLSGEIRGERRFPHTALIITLSVYLFSYLLAALLTLLATTRKASLSLRPTRDENVSSLMLPYGHRVATQNLLTQLNYRGDFYMVEWLAGWKSAGWYGVAVSLSELLWQVSQSVSLIVYSGIASAEHHDSMALTERTFRYSFWFLILGGAFMYLLAPVIPVLYGHKFARSVAPFEILLIGTVAYGATGVLTQFFTDQLGKVKYPVYMQGVCVIVNLLTCWFFIPRLGMKGGAIASSTAYMVALILSIGFYKIQTRRPLRNLFMFDAKDVTLVQKVLQRQGSQ